MSATDAGAGWFLLFRTVRRTGPSVHHLTSPQVRAAASDHLSQDAQDCQVSSSDESVLEFSVFRWFSDDRLI